MSERGDRVEIESEEREENEDEDEVGRRNVRDCRIGGERCRVEEVKREIGRDMLGDLSLAGYLSAGLRCHLVPIESWRAREG